MSDFREVLATVDRGGKRRWVYPQAVRGFYWGQRVWVSVLLILIYCSMPWIKINGKQAVLLDIPARRFTLFGTTFWATESLFLVFILASLALCLFLSTALLGRLWCGWACPETVFLEFVFRPVEALFEGSAALRRRLDAAPWTLSKVLRRTGKWVCWATISWFLANTALAYFVGTGPLLDMMTRSPLQNINPFIAAVVVSTGVLFQFGWFREQLCTIACPYARFQSVLLDPDTVLVGYDGKRGEPRGKAGHGSAAKGDCIDCGLCVRVCPTGIDIRNGLQLECVQCTACIDACDSVMRKTGRPPGLIGYRSEAEAAGRATRWLRPRVVLYSALLVFFITGFSYLLAVRSLSEFQVLRTEGNPPYSELAGGRLLNHLNVYFTNRGPREEQYLVHVSGDPAIQSVLPRFPYPVAAGQMATSPLFITFPKALLSGGKAPVEIVVRTVSGSYLGTQRLTLLGPG